MITLTIGSMNNHMRHLPIFQSLIDLLNLHLTFYNINRDTTDTEEVKTSVKQLTQLLLLARRRMASTRMFMTSSTTTSRDSLGQDPRSNLSQMALRLPSKSQLPSLLTLRELVVVTSVKLLTQLLLLANRRMASMRMFMTLLTKTLRDSLGQDLRRLSFQTALRLLSLHPFTKDIEITEISVRPREPTLLLVPRLMVLMKRFTVLQTLWLIESTGTDQRSHSCLTDPNGTSQLPSTNTITTNIVRTSPTRR